MDNEVIISFEDFGFQYTAQAEPTLYDINLKIRKGEKVLIAGPSGCGKSTLAHCINGLVPGSYPGKVTGSLTVGGKNALELGLFGLSKTVGTVLQDSDGQFIGLTVAEDIAFALENDCIPTEEMHRQRDKALERFVWLKSGGSLVIDQCEAMTVIDVNTGKFTGKRLMDDTIRTEDDVQNFLGLSTLAVIPVSDDLMVSRGSQKGGMKRRPVTKERSGV